MSFPGRASSSTVDVYTRPPPTNPELDADNDTTDVLLDGSSASTQLRPISTKTRQVTTLEDFEQLVLPETIEEHISCRTIMSAISFAGITLTILLFFTAMVVICVSLVSDFQSVVSSF
jgi:hypothetical protein